MAFESPSCRKTILKGFPLRKGAICRLLETDQLRASPLWVFQAKRTRAYKGKLQSVIEDLDLRRSPLTRCHCGRGFAKLYVRRDRLARIEPATNNVHDYRRE